MILTKLKTCALALAATSTLFTSGFAAAQTYPDKPIKLVVSLAPGGGVDFFGRTLAPKLSEILGQPVVVENRAGGGTNIAADLVAHAAPDGYTLLLSSVTTFAINPTLFKTLSYDAVKDLTPVSLSGTFRFLLVSNADFPVDSLSKFVSYAKANPKQVSFASAGPGSPHQLAMELFTRRTGIELVHVPYRGAGPAVQDLIAGHVPVMFLDVATALPYIKSGRIRALGAASAQRLDVLPGVPTISESGVPGYEASSWLGIVAPAKTPARIIAQLNAAVNRVLSDPDVKGRLAAAGADTTPGTPQAFTAYQASEIRKWGDIIKSANITPD
jgi:tripartite-type tricarboxylate transporter receptor subunit TctC